MVLQWILKKLDNGSYRIELPDSDTRSLLSEEGKLQNLNLYSLFQHDQVSPHAQ